MFVRFEIDRSVGHPPGPYMQLALIVGGLAVIFLGADWLVRGAGGLAARLGVPRFIVGLTVVSLGTSAPELFVAADAALRGAGDLVLGNVMGSNLANLGLILGISALIRPVAVNPMIVRRDLPVMLIATLFLFPVIAGGHVGRLEGGILLAAFFGYMALLFVPGRSPGSDGKDGAPRSPAHAPVFVPVQRVEELATEGSVLGHLGLVVLGCGALTLGAEALVTGALDVARALGVSELVVGLTLVAVGTSIPELATSALAAVRGESGLALGNIVGSNIANVTLVLGAAALVQPFDTGPGLVSNELPLVLLLSAVALPLAWTELRFQRWEGGLLLGSYAAVTLWLSLP